MYVTIPRIPIPYFSNIHSKARVPRYNNLYFVCQVRLESFLQYSLNLDIIYVLVIASELDSAVTEEV